MGVLEKGGGGAYLVMDRLAFGGRLDQEDMGRRLAQMHLAEPLHDPARAGKFGFPGRQRPPWQCNSRLSDPSL